MSIWSYLYIAIAVVVVAIVIVLFLPLIGVTFPAGVFNTLFFIGVVLLVVLLAVAVLHRVGVF